MLYIVIQRYLHGQASLLISMDNEHRCYKEDILFVIDVDWKRAITTLRQFKVTPIDLLFLLLLYSICFLYYLLTSLNILTCLLL